MKMRSTIFLLTLMASAILIGGDKNTDNTKCLETCKNNCQKSYTNCMNNAKTDAKKAECKKSLDLCNSVCINKTCR